MEVAGADCFRMLTCFAQGWVHVLCATSDVNIARPLLVPRSLQALERAHHLIQDFSVRLCGVSGASHMYAHGA